MKERVLRRPFLFGILAAAIIHSAAILIRELSPIPVFPALIDALAFNGTWIYIVSIGAFLALNADNVRDFFACVPEKVSLKTIEGQKIILVYEFTALAVLLFAVPAITYFYTQVRTYFNAQNPEVHRFIDYMPFTDLINRAMTSFPFFITIFTLVSILCIAIPHTYFVYKRAKRSAAPLQSAIGFGILLSAGVTASIFGLLAFNVEPWVLVILAITGPIVLLSFIIVNVATLRYHDTFVVCNTPSESS